MLVSKSNVTIPKEEYNDLLESAFKLQCLENAGVDNWDGYYYAMKEFHNEEDD
jgi:hypothetical protein